MEDTALRKLRGSWASTRRHCIGIPWQWTYNAPEGLAMVGQCILVPKLSGSGAQVIRIMNERICFNTYGDWEGTFRKLDADSCKELLMAVFSYGLRRELPEMSFAADLGFEAIRPLLDRDWEKYEGRCNRNKSNGTKGGRPKTQNNPKNPVGFSETQNEESVISKPIINKKQEIKNKKKTISIDEDEYSFDKFWELYDKKCGDKTKLRAKWDKLPLKDKKAIFDFVPRYKESRPDKRYRKDPQTFLNNRTWEDELIYDDGRTQQGLIKTDGFEWK